MKNKKLLYILLPLAVLVWGLVIYRVMQSLEAPVEQPTSLSARKKVDLASTSPDTFTLLLSYRDPFQTRRVNTTERPAVAFVPERTIAPAPITPPPPAAPAVNWPEMEYSGNIENNQKKNQIAMLRIKGETFFLKEGHVAAGIKLKRILPDSILLEFSKQSRYLQRN